VADCATAIENLPALFPKKSIRQCGVCRLSCAGWPMTDLCHLMLDSWLYGSWHHARDLDGRDLVVSRSRRCQGAPILAGVKAKPRG